MSTAEKTAPQRRPPLVMVVDDEEWSARAFESVLSPHGYSVIRCRSARQTLEHVQTISPDAILVKAELPDLTGAELCRALRTNPHIGAGTPILIASKAPLRRNERLDALASGAWELISLPVDASEMLLRLNVYVQAKFEIDNARDRSLLDMGSGLYSVRGLLRRVKELSLDAYRHRTPIACVVVAPEDEFSESAAAAIAAEDVGVAARLTRLMNAATRGSDAVGRISPTEFVVLAPRTSSEGVVKLAERLQRVADQLHNEQPEEPKLRVRFGCYAIDNFDETVVEPVEILVRATMALRRAQRDVSSPPICFFGQSYSAS